MDRARSWPAGWRHHRGGRRVDWVARSGVIGLFVALNATLLLRRGIRTDHYDAVHFYLPGAEQLRQGHLFVGRPGPWLGYEGLIALCQVAGLGLGSLVALQLVVAALAILAHYDLGRALGGPWAGLFAAGLLAANPEIAWFHGYILTDSLYTSLVILAVWGIWRAATGRWGWYPVAFGVLLFAASVRPEGWLLLLIGVGTWLARARHRRGARRLVLGGSLAGLALGALALAFFPAAIQFERPSAYLQRGDIISDYPRWSLAMPPAPPAAGGELAATVGYAARHPGETALLAVVRIGTEVLHARPYYSVRHNVVVLAGFPILYALALLGGYRVRRAGLARLVAAVIAGHLPMAALLGANEQGRYLLFYFPLICLFVGCAGAWGVQWWRQETRGSRAHRRDR